MTHDLEDRLREAFAYRSDRTEVRADDSSARRGHDVPRRRPRAVAALAAAAVLLVGGLIAVGVTRTGRPSTVPLASLPHADLPPIDVRADELSLDGWIAPPPDDASTTTWTVLDVTALPDELELVDQAGRVMLTPPIESPTLDASGRQVSHQYEAELRDVANDAAFSVVVTSRAMGPCTTLVESIDTGRAGQHDPDDDGSDVALVDINGLDAAASGALVCWTAVPGVIASVEALSPGDAGASIALARQITFTDVERLPRSNESAEPGSAAPADAQFTGTLDGVPWAATVSPSALRTMHTYVDGQPSSAFVNDRLSQPTDAPVTTGEMSIGAVPGVGVIAYGYTAPTVRTVRAVNTDAESLVLATFPRELETFFAVPIPEGVTVDTLEFLGSDGSVYATATVGPFPRDLEGTYGGLVPIVRSP